MFMLALSPAQTKVITEIRKNEAGDRIKVERTVKVSCTCTSVLCAWMWNVLLFCRFALSF